MKRRFRQVDVFAEAPQSGNPLAVVADGEGLTSQQMQRFANWTNLSETTFLLPPTTPATGDLKLGLIGPHPEGSEAAFELRAFFPKDGATVEDPVTGSLNASAAQWLLAIGRAEAPYLATQGAALGRSGRVHITTDADGEVWVGGGIMTTISGTVEL